MNKKITLLVGNGINIKEGFSLKWKDLFSNIDKKIATDEYFGNTFLYEYLFLQNNETYIREIELNKEILKSIKNTTDNAKKKKGFNENNTIHHKLMDFGFSSILTTNYDYNLEKSYKANFKPKKSTNETKHSIYRYQNINNIRIYHIHGEEKYPNSLCLNYAQYLYSIIKINSCLYQENKEQNLLAKNNNWIYDFCNNTVYILGLSLDQTELDIWWLLRKRINNRNKNNKIYYFDFIKDKNRKQCVVDLLDKYDVEIIDIEDDFDKGYDQCLKEIKKRETNK